jgi:quinol monooxygenase YgiN
MLIVTGVIKVEPAGLDAAIKAALDMVRETTREPGCQVYEFSQVLGVENTFRVYEEWDDEAALAAHTQTPHMGVFRAALGDIGVVSRNIVKIEAGEKIALG